jgi:ACS family hexuronate transporter-like MFS transporter
MTLPTADGRLPARSSPWKWWVCGLLLLATMINYMDRLTFNLTSLRIMKEFELNEGHYGILESAFATAFALGAIIFGWMADRWNVRWIYPAALLAWSVMGFVTGLAQGFIGLLLCRSFLGLAEAGNWPCALRTTQRILQPAERTFGNSILQSGAAIGAIFTPLIVLFLVARTGTWRYPFLAVGAVGFVWVALWLFSVRAKDLALEPGLVPPSLANIVGWLVVLFGLDLAVHLRMSDHPWLPLAVKGGVSALGIAGVFLWLRGATRDDTHLPRQLFFRRFWVLVTLVVTINITWHFFRAWLPLFLQKQHHYGEEFTGYFITAYYVATDLGSLAAGFATLYLARRGLPVHWSRVLVFLACALLTTLTVLAAQLPQGWPLLGMLLIIGFAALGLFPNYYSFSQEITVRHQGKVTGALGCINWLAMALLHETVGESIKQTHSYSQGVALAGLVPLVGFAALILFWGRPSSSRSTELSLPVEVPAGTDGEPAPAVAEKTPS